MSDQMRPIPFGDLMDWVLEEYKNCGTIFGVNAIYRHDCGKTLSIFGETIETSFGPAAGPHSQLSQNLIAAYVGGARFFEVKTVQVIDGEDLPVSKPCIAAQDEGYNVEWSTELTVPQAYEEYVRGWFALKLLSKEFGFGDPTGFVFNMSVGYDLAGIQSEKIDKYIEGMKHAGNSDVWKECMDWTKANLSRFRHVDEAYLKSIDDRVCRSITLSTLHGCPPVEIERIATYLLTEKSLNTYIKCNPTLLGYDFARKTMDEMGYGYLAFDDHHFKNDLQFEDAVPMIRRLQALAAEKDLEFGVKLTNTFPVKITQGELPGEEMYMSGRSLYPLSIALAEKLGRAFDGKLRISYSGGADFFNIAGIFEAGVWPITLATTLLKPGGYNRLEPIAGLLAKEPYAPFAGVDVEKLQKLAADAKRDPHHVKPLRPIPLHKISEKVPWVDCFMAPCEDGCPIGQDVPTYVKLVAEGKHDEALRVILEKNPLPFMTGTICNHRCMSRCTRNFYEEPVNIRAAKLVAAENGYDRYLAGLSAGSPRKENVAVVGGGPAGMAAAHLLARAGTRVTLFEKRNALGGIVRHVIPAFRISDSAIQKDARMLEKLGVTIRLNTEAPSAEELLKSGFTHVVLAVGAWKPGRLELKAGEALNVLGFLEQQKRAPETVLLGKHVAMIGGGNTAMDAARAAKWAQGVETVSLVYRRTKREMPADAEELELALEDGVEFRELLAPVSLENGQLICDVMRLGGADASGRRSPEPTGEQACVPADTVISAVGEQVDGEYLSANGVAMGSRGRPKSLVNGKVFVIGDALRGPATVVEGIADATAAAQAILGGVKPKDAPYRGKAEALKAIRGKLCHRVEAEKEGDRCLGCSAVCENCVDVCPNRANIAVKVPGMEREQVLHMDRMCNECGNCAVFCPYDSAPYRDKFTIFATKEDFASSKNDGFVLLDAEEQTVLIRAGEGVNGATEYTASLKSFKKNSPLLMEVIKTVLKDYAWALK